MQGATQASQHTRQTRAWRKLVNSHTFTPQIASQAVPYDNGVIQKNSDTLLFFEKTIRLPSLSAVEELTVLALTDFSHNQYCVNTRHQPLEAGTLINEKYHIDALVALGGMGEVYRAYHITTHQQVAIKFVRHDLSDLQLGLKYFEQEITIITNNKHDAILQHYDDGYCPLLKRRYLVTDYVKGITLKEKLREGALSLADTLILKERLASALAHLHTNDVLHGDVASDNVILPDGDISRAILIDFGTCCLLSSQQPPHTLSGKYGLTGKLRYCSPEHIGLFQAPTTRSDIYSLGLLLSECLAPENFHASASYADLRQKRSMLPSFSGIDEQITPLLRMMLRPDPRLRIASMHNVMSWQIFERKEYALAVYTPQTLTVFKNLKPSVHKYTFRPQTIAASIAGLMLLGTAGALSAALIKDFNFSHITAFIAQPELTEEALETQLNTASLHQDVTIKNTNEQVQKRISQKEDTQIQAVPAPQEHKAPINSEPAQVAEPAPVQLTQPIISTQNKIQNLVKQTYEATKQQIIAAQKVAAIIPETLKPQTVAPEKITSQASVPAQITPEDAPKSVVKKPVKTVKLIEDLQEEETTTERKKRVRKPKAASPQQSTRPPTTRQPVKQKLAKEKPPRQNVTRETRAQPAASPPAPEPQRTATPRIGQLF